MLNFLAGVVVGAVAFYLLGCWLCWKGYVGS